MKRGKDEKNEVSRKKCIQERKKKEKKDAKTKHTEYEVVTKKVCTFKINKGPLRIFLDAIAATLPDDVSIVYTYKRKKED
jgi:hypothetical protein